MITVVAGPPCAGKTTYVAAHRQPGDQVLDWDDVFAELTGLPVHDRGVQDRAAVEAQAEQVFRSRMDALTQGWIIRLAPNSRHRAIMRRLKGARSVVLALPIDECLDRLRRDPSRDQERDAQAIRQWWSAYSPSHSMDESVIVDQVGWGTTAQ